jgi:hypothetical protein
MGSGVETISWWRSAASASVVGVPIWRLVVGAVSLLVLGVGVYKQIHPQYLSPDTSDFFTYYQSALAVRSGSNPFAPVIAWIHGYAPGDPLLPVYYVYAPIFAMTLVPLTVVPLETANLIWGVLNTALLFGAIYAFLRFAEERATPLKVLLLTTAASLSSVVRLELYWGQADILLLFLLCAALWAGRARQSILAGALLAVACVIKPPMLILLVFLLWKREYRFALAAAGGFVLLLLGPFLFLGAGVLRDQLTIWSFWSSQYAAFNDNESVRGILAHFFTVNPYVRPVLVAPALAVALWLLFAAAVALFIVARVRPQRLGSDTQSLIEVGLVVVGMLLVSPLTEYIYTTLLTAPLLVLYIFLSRQGIKTAPYQRLAVALTVIWALLCLPLYKVELTFANHMNLESSLTGLYMFLAVPYLYAMFVILAMLVYAGTLIGVRGLPTRDLFGAISASAAQWLVYLTRGLRTWKVT